MYELQREILYFSIYPGPCSQYKIALMVNGSNSSQLLLIAFAHLPSSSGFSAAEFHRLYKFHILLNNNYNGVLIHVKFQGFTALITNTIISSDVKPRSLVDI
jgi:hypothetical protein